MKYAEIYKKQQIYAERLGKIDPVLKKKMERSFEIEFAHNSTAIEGNTLTLMETKLILEDGISVGEKPLREIYEVVNHQKAFEYAKTCISKGLSLSGKIIKDIHQIICENIFTGGIYRSQPVYITGAQHIPPTGERMLDDLKNFFRDLENRDFPCPIELAAWTHAQFVKIHPFIDGNGRTSRMIMNYQLLQKIYPPVSISALEKFKYYDALEIYAVKGDLEPFKDLIASLILKELDKYINS